MLRMKPDLCTKAVLSVIAFLLAFVTSQTNAIAQKSPANATPQMIAKYLWDTLLTHCGDSGFMVAQSYNLCTLEITSKHSRKRI